MLAHICLDLFELIEGDILATYQPIYETTVAGRCDGERVKTHPFALGKRFYLFDNLVTHGRDHSRICSAHQAERIQQKLLAR